jgi:hypothetical protein
MSDRRFHSYETTRDNRQSQHHPLCHSIQYNYCVCARRQPNEGQQDHNSYHYGQPESIQHPQAVWVERDRGYDAHGGAMNDQASHSSVEPGSVCSDSNDWYNHQRPVIPMGERVVRAEDVMYPSTSSNFRANIHSGWLSCRTGAFGGWDDRTYGVGLSSRYRGQKQGSNGPVPF